MEKKQMSAIGPMTSAFMTGLEILKVVYSEQVVV
jgi:hypothetical protein